MLFYFCVENGFCTHARRMIMERKTGRGMTENEKKVFDLYEQIIDIVDSDETIVVTSFLVIHRQDGRNALSVSRRSSDAHMLEAVQQFLFITGRD